MTTPDREPPARTPPRSQRPPSSRSNQWVRRRALAWTVRVLALAIPISFSVLLGWLLMAVTPSPDHAIPAVARWALIATVSSLGLVALERLARRLLPIAALLDLSLVFPDAAPSRFRVAMRTSTTQQLRKRVAEARSGRRCDTPAEAATRTIELVAALRMHDRITRGHAERVWGYTKLIADELDLPDHERDRLRWAGLLHDIGKLLVPTEILNKTSRLTDDEFEVIKAHPENGRTLITDLVPWLGESARAVWEHHEKWDGTGYPRGLAGTEISRAARIVAVADVYDVMTSARSYKEPIAPEEARRELARCAGTHFDPEIVRAFLNVSIARVRRAAGPLSWLAQLSLFPSAVLSSTQAAGGVAVLTGVLGVGTAGWGSDVLADALPIDDTRPRVELDRADRAIDGATAATPDPPSGTQPAVVPTTGPRAESTPSTSDPRVSTVPLPTAPPPPSSPIGPTTPPTTVPSVPAAPTTAPPTVPVVPAVPPTTTPTTLPVPTTILPPSGVVDPVIDAVDPIVTPVIDAVEPVVTPVVDAVDPIVAPVAPVLDPVVGALDPLLGTAPSTPSTTVPRRLGGLLGR